MDKIDRSILSILQENARIPNVELADRVGFPHLPVCAELPSWNNPVLSPAIMPD